MKHASKVDRRFKYVPAAKTDVSKTFARARRELEEKAAREAQAAARTVTPIKARSK